ncbi:hypothetical protein GQ43DRAFT_474415 [Delitschia confertaspora ATCC 74209]|uniref:DNA-directed RNA polymerase I subunit RPA34.5 n=1 Tax=Delitschia confertaspora ATCC 74209 TaxID=1513339 RepID=A0A9P4JGA0_9PLEO|nr:hypothetical protein GQ43DRAFT_474415 [Delitschia confertaspora ATCC 74209]
MSNSKPKSRDGAMKKAKETRVPLLGERAKSMLAKEAKQYTSNEFIGSSDDSDVEREPEKKESVKEKKEKSKKEKKSPVTIAVHRPKTNGKESKPKKALKPVKTPVPPPTVNGDALEEISSSEESDGDEKRPADIPQKENVEGGPEKDTSTGESSSESESEEDEDEEMLDAPDLVADPAAAATSHTVQFRPPPPFEPPRGFKPVSNYNTSASTTNAFKGLKGKQIWHITAPAGVPVQKIKELALEKISDGNSVLNYKGIDYGFIAGDANETDTMKVMVPSSNGYVAVPKPLRKSLHLQEVIRLPSLTASQSNPNTGSAAAASVTAASTKAPRPQPKGLRMRYFPSGFGDKDPGILGSSDDEAETAPAVGLGVPKFSQNKSEKRTRDGAAVESPAKKVKKTRDPEEEKRRAEKKERKRLKESAKAQK